MKALVSDIDSYDYVISIDVGTTFSGSCYIYTKDKNTIVHVTKWPEQKAHDNFEKTPTACLYNISTTTPRLISWGKAAVDHVTAYPNDTNNRFISQFKLKLQSISQKKQTEGIFNDYRTAAVDYLRAIHQYTCKQLIENNPEATYDQFRYVLTIPATWVNTDAIFMRKLAQEAGLISSTDPKSRLVVLSEAHAASLFCEREYCVTTARTLCKGQRYLVCDAGGGTVDLATYECTDTKEHCQLALESGDNCGSTILDQKMEMYLKDQVFFSCIEDVLLNELIDQFKTKIKHYFGSDNAKNNYIEPKKSTNQNTDIEHAQGLAASSTITTTNTTEMKDIQENDYNYQADYDEYDSDSMSFDYEDQEDFEDSDKDDGYVPDSLLCHESTDKKDDVGQYVYFTLPEKGTGIDPSILENLSLRGSITSEGQLRVSCHDISKYIFDPVVDTVMTLIRKQIKKSYTTIDTLFLLGGFGQSPYLYKKLHEEFITNTNAVKHLIVPEDGYRASMRGGVHYGMDCGKVIPKHYLKNQYGELLHHSLDCHPNRVLVAIDFDFYNFTAVYSFLDLTQVEDKGYAALSNLFELKLTMENYDIKNFSFDTNRFLDDFLPQIVTVLRKHERLIFEENFRYISINYMLRQQIYYDIFMKGFMQQLFEQIQLNYYALGKSDVQDICYCASISNSRMNFDYGKIFNYDPTIPSYEEEDTPMITLKYQLRVALVKVKGLSPRLCNSMATLLADILDKNAFPTADHIIKQELPVRMSNVCQSIGMIEREASETQFVWQNLGLDIEPVDPGVPYFSLMNYWIQSTKLHLENKHNVLVFDLGHDYLENRHNREPEPKCRVYSSGVHGVITSFNNAKYRLNYNMFHYEKIRTPYARCITIIKGIQEGTFTIYELLAFIGTETNFLASEQLRHYIRENVDLADPERKHSIGDLFLECNFKDVIEMNFRMASSHLIPAIHDAIRLFAKKTITTDQIRSFLIIPWIKYISAPAFIDTYKRFFSIIDNQYDTLACFIVTEPLVETAFGGRRAYQNTNKTCSEYMLGELKDEIITRLAPIYNVTVCFLPNAQVNRHFGCLIQGACLSRPNTDDQEVMERISRRTYAVHFLNFYVKKPSIMSEKTEKEERKKGKDREKNDEERKKQYGKPGILLDLQDSLVLYPLLRKDYVLTINSKKALDNATFYAKHECSVAAVLYASDEYIEPQDYYISNNAFKKLHRFIIPVKDTSKPIQFDCLVEDYSIIFNVEQAEHKADFRCNDLMFRVVPENPLPTTF